jgi:hypothetical protein
VTYAWLKGVSAEWYRRAVQRRPPSDRIQAHRVRLGPGQGNLLGHWEPKRLLEINQEILGTLGRTWHDPRPIPRSWLRSKSAYAFQTRLTDEIASGYGDGTFILIKEPRICRLAPLYLDALDVLEIEPLVILLIRHPAEVIRSIYERDGGDVRTHELRWLRHLIESEEASRTCTRVWSSFDQVLEDWRTTAQSISEGLGIAWPNEFEQVGAEVGNVLRPRQRHHEIMVDDPAPLHLGPLTMRAWQAAQTALRGDEVFARRLFDEIRTVVNEFDRLTSPQQECFERQIADADARLAQISETLAELQAKEIAQRDEIVRCSAVAERNKDWKLK